MLLQFIRAKCYNGVDYGPGYPEDVCDVDEKWARIFLISGAAVAVVAKELPPIPTLSSASLPIVESRDPKPSARRGKK